MELWPKAIPGQWAGIILWAKASVNADRPRFGTVAAEDEQPIQGVPIDW
jgi:hypothetical protein